MLIDIFLCMRICYKVFHTISHCDATTPASMIATKLHFHLQFHQSKLGYGREKRVTRKNTKNKGNNIMAVVNIVPMRKKQEHENNRRKVNDPW